MDDISHSEACGEERKVFKERCAQHLGTIHQ